MSTIFRRRTVFSAFTAVLTFALAAPIAFYADEVIAAEEQILPALPTAPSWDETSGYGSVETNRAAASALRALVAGPSWDDTSGYGAVEAIRAAIGHDVVSRFGATGHEASAAIGRSWDEMSGYGTLEASRAANALLVAEANDLGTALLGEFH